MFDEIIESYGEKTKTITTSFNKKKQTVKQRIFIFYLPFH